MKNKKILFKKIIQITFKNKKKNMKKKNIFFYQL